MNRFIEGYNKYYDIALKELKNGRKDSHYMWFIFPQIKGLGSSYNSNYYGLNGIDETKQFCNNDYLFNKLINLVNVLLDLTIADPIKIFGVIDSRKLKSSMTIFYLASNNILFKKVLDKFFNGELDKNTVELIA